MARDKNLVKPGAPTPLTPNLANRKRPFAIRMKPLGVVLTSYKAYAWLVPISETI